MNSHCRYRFIAYHFAHWLLAGIMLAGATGCSKSDKVYVSGNVTLKDGTPVEGVRVLFRSNKTGNSARGLTDANGRYELSSLAPGDGIEPGKYYVTLAQNTVGEDNTAPTIYHEKYRSPTQELIFDVESDQANVIDIKLDPQ